jgi:hypothetical protein
MESDQRIDDLERSGVISPRQARRLRESLASMTNSARLARPKGRSWPVYLAAVGVIGVVALVFVLAGNPYGYEAPPPPPDDSLDTVLTTPAPDRVVFKTITWSLLLTSPFLAMMIYYNRLLVRENRVFRRWEQLEHQFLSRALLLPNLIEAAASMLGSPEVRPPFKSLPDAQQSDSGPDYRPDDTADSNTDRTTASIETISSLVDETTSELELLARLLAEGERLVHDQGLLDQVSTIDAALKHNLDDFVAYARGATQAGETESLSAVEDDLEKTEYRIMVTRMRFNEAVSAYNAPIRRPPGTFMAGLGNFHPKSSFADETADPGQVTPDRGPGRASSRNSS